MNPSWTSPLREIEHRVQERAKQLSVSLHNPNGAALIRRFVEEEVSAWVAEHESGLFSTSIADPPALAERAWRNVAGYGPLHPLLADDDVWEIMVNAPDAIFVRRHRGRSGYHDEVFHDEEHVQRTLMRILDDAAGSHRKFDPSEGLQDAQLADGARVHIVHGDIARGGHTLFNIRKFTGVAFRSLDELVQQGSLDQPSAKFLRAAVRSRLSIVFAGRPGSGKTTLLSCCAAELDPTLRVVVAEEVFETDIPLPNVAHLQTRPPRPDRPAIGLRQLVSGFLRMAPDVAIVGEVRDSEALPLLMTLSSGVSGFTTVHAASARQALSRLRFLAQLAGPASQISPAALGALVSESVDLVVHCARNGDRVEVTEVCAVEDLQAAAESNVFTLTPIFSRPGPGAPLYWSGCLPSRARHAFGAKGYDVTELLAGCDRAMSKTVTP